MDREFVPRSAIRARWLAELSEALDEAQMLLAQLAAERIDRADADHLRTRIEELRAELRSLHRRGFAPARVIEPPRQLQPDWWPQRG